jgi:exonuclease III
VTLIYTLINSYVIETKESNKETSELNYTIEQMDLADICRMLHSTPEKYTFFSAAHGNFSKIDLILSHKSSLHKYKKTEIVSCILRDHSRIKLDINSQRNSRNPTNIWRLNTTLLNDQWVTENIKE